jgi:hypothetical protein
LELSLWLLRFVNDRLLMALLKVLLLLEARPLAIRTDSYMDLYLHTNAVVRQRT